MWLKMTINEDYGIYVVSSYLLKIRHYCSLLSSENKMLLIFNILMD